MNKKSSLGWVLVIALALVSFIAPTVVGATYKEGDRIM
jgi:hypothetical protein